VCFWLRVLQDSHAFHRDERAASDHLVKDRKRSVNMPLIVDDFNHDGQIRGHFNQASV
jgi:hypothetical protein